MRVARCLPALIPVTFLILSAVAQGHPRVSRAVARHAVHRTAREQSRAAGQPAPDLNDLHERLAVIQRQAQIRREQTALVHGDLWLHADGTQLYTAWNAPMTLRAINWYGFEYAPYAPGGLDKAPLDTILQTVRSSGFNALRILFSDQTVEDNPVVTRGLEANPALRGLHALDLLGRVLQRAHHFHLRVILCNSRSEGGMGPEIDTGLWYTDRYPETAWENDWLTLASRFRSDSAFVGADLRNEPHITGSTFDLHAYLSRGPLWGAYNGTYYLTLDWHNAAQTLGNRLLAVNPHLLIVVEGIQMYYDPFKNKLTGALWGSNLIGVQYDPVVLSVPGHLVYSVHEYGPKMWKGSWFNSRTTYGKLAFRWTRHWGYLLTAPRFMQAPIFVGEFGTCDDWHSCISDPHKPMSQGFWFASFIRYLHNHPQVGWAYWSLNPDGPFRPGEDNFYSLMTRDWYHVHPLVLAGLAPLLGQSH